MSHGLEVGFVFKAGEGMPNVVDAIRNGEIDLVINTPLGRQSRFDEKAIRKASTQYVVPCITTLSGARAAASAIRALQHEDPHRAEPSGIPRGAACDSPPIQRDRAGARLQVTGQVCYQAASPGHWYQRSSGVFGGAGRHSGCEVL